MAWTSTFVIATCY